MKPTLASAHLLRTRALALLVMAVVGVGMIAVDWIGPAHFPTMLPIIIACIVFNFGFVFTFRAGCLTRGSRFGAGAVLLNFLAMFLRDFEVAWRLTSIGACLVSLVAAGMLFGEARASMA